MGSTLLDLNKALLFVLTFGLCGFEANAQNWIPSVSVPAPNSIEDYERCDQEMVDHVDTRTFKACLDGQEQARYTAEQFALTNGKLHGYLEGFSYALFHATDANRQHAEEMARGKQALLANGPTMQAGIDKGVETGLALGAENGERDALALWSQAFVNGKVPSAASSDYYSDFIPEYQMNLSSPYEFYVGRKSEEQIMREDIDQSLRNTIVNIPDQQVYLVTKRQYNTWDLWFDQGRYEVQRYKSGGWVHPDESFKFWKKYSEKLGQYDVNSYSNLPTEYTDQIAKVEKEVRNPDGTTKIVMVSATMNLQEIFKDAFLESYRYYMHHNFNKGFHEYLKMGAFAGELVGVQVGKRIAYENGYAEAYDNKFWYDAEKAYINSYQTAYSEAFDKVFKEYAQNAILSVLRVETIGEVEDGILSPGERVKFMIELENRGGEYENDVELHVMGDVPGTIAESLGAIKSFATTTFETDYVLQISNSHDVTKNIHLDFEFLGSNAIGTFYNSRIDIQNQIESIGLAYFNKLEPIDGKVTVVLPVKNVSTTPATGIFTEVLINGKQAGVAYVGNIEASSELMATVALSGLDPIALIDGINAIVHMTLNGTVIDDAEGKVLIKSQNPAQDIAAIYLNAVSNNGRTLVTKEKAESKLLKMNNEQVISIRNRSNYYKRNPSATIPGQLLLQRSKGNPSTDQALDDLAVKMWLLNQKSLPSFLSSKRRYYKKMLDQLTLSGNVKKAAKFS